MTELGQKLKEARGTKGLSIDQLHEITKIQKRHLVAIEEGNYDVLPGAFYARAFIKQYADAVGLNGEELLVEYQSTIPQSEKRDVPQVSTGQKNARNNAKVFIMANCRSYAKNLSCAVSYCNWSSNLVCFPSVDWKR